MQPWCTPFPIWNQSVVPCPVLTVASWPAYRFLKRQVRWSGIPIPFRISHSLLWHYLIIQSSEVTCLRSHSSYPRTVAVTEKQKHGLHAWDALGRKMGEDFEIMLSECPGGVPDVLMTMVHDKGWFCPSGKICQSLKTFLVVTTWGGDAIGI